MNLDQVNADLKALKLKNWRVVWEPFMKKYRCNSVCELGIFRGDNFLGMIAHKPKIAVAVDTWNNDGVHAAHDASYSKQELNNQYQTYKSRVAGLPFVKTLKEDTASAAEHFRNNYFDFVYIDADATLEGTTDNIESWYPKVKYGGFLAGHNYNKKYGAYTAVNKFVKDKKLTLLWRPPSIWMVVKT